MNNIGKRMYRLSLWWSGVAYRRGLGDWAQHLSNRLSDVGDMLQGRAPYREDQS